MTEQSLWFQGISAQQSREFLRRSESSISKSIERLSTGLRINSGADDPSGLSLSRAGYANRMGRIQAAVENLQLGINFMDLRYEGLVNSREALMRIRDIAVRSANDAVITDDQRVGMQEEVDGLLEAIDHKRNIMFQMDLGSSEGPTPLFDPGQLDVVWVMDETGSMNWVMAAIEAAAPQMFATLQSKGFDLLMGAVGYGNGAGVLGTTLPPPNNALTIWGDKLLKDYAGGLGGTPGNDGFVNDVHDIGTHTGFGVERGLDGTLEAIWGTGIKAQLDARPDAKRVVIMLTDADSDDFGVFGGAPQTGLSVVAGAAAARDFVVSSLDSIGAAFYVVSTITEGGGPFPADADYTDVSSRVAAGGGSMALDLTNNWVTTISNTLQAYGGPWDMRFHFGPESEDWFEYTLDTVVPATMGISGLDVSTALTAQNSITRVDAAVDFLSGAFRQTGYLRGLLDRIITRQEDEYINLAQVNSNIMDADMAAEIVGYTKETLVQNAAVSIMANSNAAAGNMISLIESNLTEDFSINLQQQTGTGAGAR
jgi:flagellin